MTEPEHIAPDERDQKSSSEETSVDSPLASPASAYSGDPGDLHDLFTGPEGNDEEDPLAALRNDPNYSALIRDLEYIATQARLLFEPAEEAPSDKVWDNIQSQLPKLDERGE
jgi:hypothetical protein